MYTAKVHDRAVQWRRGWNLTPYKKVGCADWILSGRLSCYSGNIAGDISYIIKNGLAGIIPASRTTVETTVFVMPVCRLPLLPTPCTQLCQPKSLADFL